MSKRKSAIVSKRTRSQKMAARLNGTSRPLLEARKTTPCALSPLCALSPQALLERLLSFMRKQNKRIPSLRIGWLP
jgi:hypothetical protein